MDGISLFNVVEVNVKMFIKVGNVYFVKGDVDFVFLKVGGEVLVCFVLLSLSFLWYLSVDCMVDSVFNCYKLFFMLCV